MVMTTLMVVSNPPPKVAPMEFSRRLRELVAGEQQREVANKLGYTASRISQILRGEKPSREFVERVIEVYEVDRDLWLGYAGYGAAARATDPTEAVASAVVRQLLEQGYVAAPSSASRVNDAPPEMDYSLTFTERYRAMRHRLEAEGIPVPGKGSDFNGSEGLTPEDAVLEVEELERVLRKLKESGQ